MMRTLQMLLEFGLEGVCSAKPSKAIYHNVTRDQNKSKETNAIRYRGIHVTLYFVDGRVWRFVESDIFHLL